MISNIVHCKVETRLMTANDIFNSKLIFQIGLWGGTEEFLLNSLQIVQNKAARFVTRRDRYTPVVELLRQCGWLSVRQLVFFHSASLIYKTIKTTYPKYLSSKLSSEIPYNTRLAQSDAVRMGPEFKAKLELTEKSFMNRGTVSFNQLPSDIRQTTKVESFRKKLKVWVMQNCQV